MKYEFLRVLQKYNIQSTQKPLSERLIEPHRFAGFSQLTDGLLLDFSRTGMAASDLEELLAVAEEAGVEDARQRLFNADNINFTENRPALHMALRSDDVLNKLDQESVDLVTRTRERMQGFTSAFAAGHLPGNPEQAVKHIIHIGIGGSVLGPRLLIEALGNSTTVQVHFLSSIDAHLRTDLLTKLDPAETAVVVATKSFTTGETLLHAARVRLWMEQSLGHDAAMQRYLPSVATRQQ